MPPTTSGVVLVLPQIINAPELQQAALPLLLLLVVSSELPSFLPNIGCSMGVLQCVNIYFQ